MQIFTSIPMKFARPLNGEDEGPRYLARCIESWRRNGFNVRSVCRPHELAAATALAPGIEIIVSDVDDALYPARLGPSFGALLTAAPKNEPFGIINADIYTVHSPSIVDRLRRATATGLAFAGRTEFGTRMGRYSFRKIDFIALDPRLLAEVLDNPQLRQLQLGIPWWSWAFPIAASFVGPLYYFSRPFLLHMEHANRWAGDAMEASSAVALSGLRQIGERTDTKEARRFIARIDAVSTAAAKHAVCKQWLFGDDGADRKLVRVRPTRDPLFRRLASPRYHASLFLDHWRAF